MSKTTAIFALEIQNAYIRFNCSGVMDKAAFLRLHNEIKTAIEKRDAPHRCLIDLTQSELQLSTLDRYELGSHTSQLLPDVKFATLVSVDSEHVDKFYETVATNRGVRVLVTNQEKEAMNWLLAAGN